MTRSRQQKKKDIRQEAPHQQATSVDEQKAARRETKGLLPGVISVFLLFHLVAITCWSVPLNSTLLIGVRELVRPYMLWTGLFQSWDMFAPNPMPVNTYMKAVVITQKHHIHVWEFPRMVQLSYLQRYQEERYRKFAESLLEEQYQDLSSDVTKHIARFYNDPTDPPEKVLLIKYQTDIKPGVDDGYIPAPQPNVFYEYYIEPQDLK